MLNLKKIMYFYIALIFTLQATSVMAFDLEDYATTYRATRDAWLKAANELKLATGPYKSARDGYSSAVKKYVSGLNEGNPAVAKAKITDKHMKCALVYQDDGTFLGNGPTQFLNQDTINTELATREAFTKAAREAIKTAYQLKAAEDTYKQASYIYIKSTEIHDRYILQKQINMQQK